MRNRALLVMGLLCTASSAGAHSVLLVDNPAKPASLKLEMDFGASLFAANDMVAVNSFDDDVWPSDYRTRATNNRALGNGRVEFSARKLGWNVAYFYRQDWLIDANRDAVDIYAMDKNGQLPITTRTYQFDYANNGFEADGLKFGYSKDLRANEKSGFILGLSASLLRGLAMRDERTQGMLDVNGTNSTGILKGTQNIYSTFLKSGSGTFYAFNAPQENIANGLGYGFDLGATYYAPNGAKASFVVNDLFGRIRWDKIPHIASVIDTTCTPGCATTGTNAYDAHTLKLDPKFSVSGEYPLGPTMLVGQLESQNGLWFPLAGLRYAVTPSWTAGLDYESRFGSLGLSLTHSNFNISLASQPSGFNSSRVLGLTLGAHYAF